MEIFKKKEMPSSRKEYSRYLSDKTIEEAEYAIKVTNQTNDMLRGSHPDVGYMPSITETDRIRFEAFRVAFEMLEKRMLEVVEASKKLEEAGQEEAIELNQQYDELLSRGQEAIKSGEKTMEKIRVFEKEKLDMHKSKEGSDVSAKK